MSRWFRSYGFADVLDDLLVGAYPLDSDDVATLGHMGIRRVLNLTQDDEYRPGDRQAVERALIAAGIEERRLSLTDYGALPPAALEAAVQEVNGWLDDGVRTYVHCRAGWQRSAAVAAGVVAVRTGRDIEDALDYVQLRKPSADPLPHQREDLRRWWAGRGNGSADPDQANGSP
ncbi:MAG: protein-tyrosine phosphatase family protein [Solirubrobacteraceae bacterium]